MPTPYHQEHEPVTASPYAPFLDREPPPIRTHPGPVEINAQERYCYNCNADILPTMGHNEDVIPAQCRVRPCCKHPMPVNLAQFLRQGEYILTH